MAKIVFLDIDGTLVTPNYPLSALVKKGIKKARENGHLIFLCTGRNRVGIESIQMILMVVFVQRVVILKLKGK